MTDNFQGTDQAKLKALVSQVLDQAHDAGASSAEAGVSVETGLSVTARLGEVETIEHHNDRGLGVTVYFDQRKGSASTSDLSETALQETVDAACRIARYTAADEFSGLADVDRMATQFPDLDLYHPWELSADKAIELTLECETAARDLDSRIVNSEGASLNSHRGLRVYGNSHGFLAARVSSRHSIDCSLISQDEKGMQRDYWYSVARAAQDLESPRQIGIKAGERALRRLGGQQLSTRQAPVIFAAEVATSLIGHLLGAIQGTAQYRQASFLLDHIGKKIFPDFVRLHEQPHLPRALGSTAFDAEGVATVDRDIVSGGVLQSYVLGSYSARKLGMESTGNAGGVHNLSLDAGDKNLDQLLADMDTGFLVTELMGQGVNNVTGDYSRGAAGFWVEKGKIAYPVEEVTIAGHLRDMFAGIIAVGTDTELRGNIRTGSIMLDNLTIAGS